MSSARSSSKAHGALSRWMSHHARALATCRAAGAVSWTRGMAQPSRRSSIKNVRASRSSPRAAARCPRSISSSSASDTVTGSEGAPTHTVTEAPSTSPSASSRTMAPLTTVPARGSTPINVAYSLPRIHRESARSRAVPHPSAVEFSRIAAADPSAPRTDPRSARCPPCPPAAASACATTTTCPSCRVARARPAASARVAGRHRHRHRSHVEADRSHRAHARVVSRPPRS